MASVARHTGLQVAHYIMRTLNFDSAASGVAVEIGTIPANAVVISGGVTVKTAFNAGTTNVIDVGFATDSLSSGNTNAYTSSITSLTAGTKFLDALGSSAAKPRAADTSIVAAYTQTGTAASAGAAEVWIVYLPKP